MRMIELTRIISDRTPSPSDRFSDTDEPGENVGAAVIEVPAVLLVTVPVFVNVECIRCFTPRKDERVGTRLTFSDGGGFAVTETYDEVKALAVPTVN